MEGYRGDAYIDQVIPNVKMSNFLLEDYEAIMKSINAKKRRKSLDYIVIFSLRI